VARVSDGRRTRCAEFIRLVDNVLEMLALHVRTHTRTHARTHARSFDVHAQQPGRDKLASASRRVLLRLNSMDPYVGLASPLVRYVWKGHHSSPCAS
jgi:hypothetical protein